jgi:hypothetical protein
MDTFFASYFTTTSTSDDAPEQEPAPDFPVDANGCGGCVIA